MNVCLTLTHTHAHIHTHTHSERERERETDRQTDRQTDRDREKETETETERALVTFDRWYGLRTQIIGSAGTTARRHHSENQMAQEPMNSIS